MIRFLLLQNCQGKVRLCKFFVSYSPAERMKLLREIHQVVVSRERRWTHFVEFRNCKLVYRMYAGLFFIFGVDVNDNELAVYEFIHLLVEILDDYFGNVCELDLVWHFHDVYALLDQLLVGGELLQTNKTEVLAKMKEIDRLD
eukprot:GHVT01039450.1.p2 GENE.GHVT01039450.1~~GHVT01039450.1.p2  ORF type:complete len:143 (+),score=8.98 GHVT01039450.1:1595-2023(+)